VIFGLGQSAALFEDDRPDVPDQEQENLQVVPCRFFVEIAIEESGFDIIEWISHLKSRGWQEEMKGFEAGNRERRFSE